MKQGSAHHSDDVLSDVQSQFARWRNSRTRGTRIPAPLWRAAVDAAREHGASKTAQALHLDYYGLKRRLESALSGPVRGSGFLEIPLCTPSAAECVLELEDGHGARLRAELKGAAMPELESLARVFWSLER